MQTFCGFLEKKSQCRHNFSVRLNLHNWAHNSKDFSRCAALSLGYTKYGVRLDNINSFVYMYSDSAVSVRAIVVLVIKNKFPSVLLSCLCRNSQQCLWLERLCIKIINCHVFMPIGKDANPFQATWQHVWTDWYGTECFKLCSGSNKRHYESM